MRKEREGQLRASLEFLPGSDGRLGPQQLQNHLWPAPSHQMPARCFPKKEGRGVVSTGAQGHVRGTAL